MAKSQLQKYPVDFTSLEKGTWIESGAICDMLGIAPDEADWSLKVLKLVGMIRDQCGILSRQEGHRLRLMNDIEASTYNYNQLETATRKQARCAENLALIDPSEMNDEQLRGHDARSRVIAATVVAAGHAKEKQRKVEGLLRSGSLVGRLRLTD